METSTRSQRSPTLLPVSMTMAATIDVFSDVKGGVFVLFCFQTGKTPLELGGESGGLDVDTLEMLTSDFSADKLQVLDLSERRVKITDIPAVVQRYKVLSLS